MSRSLCSILLVCFASLSSFSQTASLDNVRIIGDVDDNYESMISDCNTLLLSVTDNSMQLAFDSWSDMLQEMETTAAAEGLDLKGAKLWINMFWNADGSIRQIYYYPKPTSKNMDFEALSQFMSDFASSYVFSLDHEECFSHYGSATFPIRVKLSSQAK